MPAAWYELELACAVANNHTNTTATSISTLARPAWPAGVDSADTGLWEHLQDPWA